MDNKNTFFLPSPLISSQGKWFHLDFPSIMGILNLSDDSFYDDGSRGKDLSMEQKVEKMIAEGMDILDVGAMSTKPGAKEIEAEEEWQRLELSLKKIRKNFPELIISVDTYRASVAQRALDLGVHIINDISGGSFDAAMWSVVAKAQVPYIMMHTTAKPAVMQQHTNYEDVVQDILAFFSHTIHKATQAGIQDIIIDPGFGFGKTLAQNYLLLDALTSFQIFGKPVLVGLSRKSMVSKVLNVTASEALNGTTVLHTIALLKGVQFLRVHDVAAACEVKKMIQFLKNTR